MFYTKRTLKDTILKLSDNFKVILLTGMRQVGKTTLLKELSGNGRTYVTLDNAKDLLMAQEEPEFFFQTYQPPALIDEIQYAPELFNHIKIIADNAPDTGLIWMTGSQQFHLMKGVTESLAGRVAILELLGYSIYERDGLGDKQVPFLPSPTPPSVLKRYNLKETYDIIWRGSYPAIVSKDVDVWSNFYSSYIKTYIERDVRQIANISNQTDFIKFLSTVAARTAQELNIADIARNVGISPNTAKAWLSILESSGVIYLLKPYYRNVTKRFIKKPKLYFTDTGLCSSLTSWNSPESLERGAMSGAIFETFVVMEIIKSYHHNGKYPAFYFYRDSVQTEIDLLIEQDGLLYPIEIKKTSNPSKDDLRGFKKIAEEFAVGYGTLICMTDKPRPLTEGANAISIWDI
ncbi:MAG: ATP-binding protein [Deferribacteraceae bacterium]|jgi:predicted AAA+ superfamily ATPase|nr:ATP-binding protein [Deferribacteraceae bacterium]